MAEKNDIVQNAVVAPQKLRRTVSDRDITEAVMNNWQREEVKEGKGYFVKDVETGEKTGEYQSYDWVLDSIEGRTESDKANLLELNKGMPRVHFIRAELEDKMASLMEGGTGKKTTSTFGESLRNEMSSVSDRGDKLSSTMVSAWSEMTGEERRIVASDMVSNEVPDDMKGKANIELRKKHGLGKYGENWEAMQEIQIHTPKGEKIYLVATDLGDGDIAYQINHSGTKGFVETSKEAFNSAIKSHRKRIDKISKISTDEMMNNPNALMDAWYGKPEVTAGDIYSKEPKGRGWEKNKEVDDVIMPELKKDDEDIFKPYIASKKKAGYKVGV